MNLRKATRDDLNAVSALYASAIGTPGCTWNEHYPGPLELEHDLHRESLYVLTDQDRVIGAVSVVVPRELDHCAEWERPTNAAEIARVVIHRRYAGQSLAVTMLEALFDQLKGAGCEAVHLSAAVCNHAAVRTYKKLGFRFFGEKDMYGNRYHLCERLL